MPSALVFIFLGGLAVSTGMALLATPVIRRLAYQQNWVDAPDGKRKLHERAVPQVGGLAILLAFIVGLLYFALLKPFLPAHVASYIILPPVKVLLGGVLIAAAGLYDDLRGMHFGFKFAAQIGVALMVVFSGYSIEIIGNPITGEMIRLPSWISVPLTVGWIVGIINAINLLDGMDGLAGGVSVIVFGSLTAAYAVFGNWGSLVLVIVAVGALLGFLWYNFNPATIFMGDTGSMFLGYLLSTYSLVGASHASSLLALLIPIIAMGLPVIDTGLAIVRRFVERRPLFQPDRDHIHHRIAHRLGLSHRNTVLVLYLISIVFGVVAFMLSLTREEIGDNVTSTLILCVTSLGIYWLLRVLGYLPPLKRHRRPWRRAQQAKRQAMTGPTSSNGVELVTEDDTLSPGSE